MAPTSKSRTTHPSVSHQIEHMLKTRSIDFDFEPNVRISEIRDAEGNQVRLTEHRAPKDQVAKYAVAIALSASTGTHVSRLGLRTATRQSPHISATGLRRWRRARCPSN